MIADRWLVLAALGLLACSEATPNPEPAEPVIAEPRALDVDGVIAELRLDCSRGYIGGPIGTPDAGELRPAQADEQGVESEFVLRLLLADSGVAYDELFDPVIAYDRTKLINSIAAQYDLLEFTRESEGSSVPVEAWVYGSGEIDVADLEFVLEVLDSRDIPTKLVLARAGPPPSREFMRPELAQQVLAGPVDQRALALANQLTGPAKVCPPIFEGFAAAAGLKRERRCERIVDGLQAGRAICPPTTDWPLITTLVAIAQRGELAPRTRVLVPIEIDWKRPPIARAEDRWGAVAASWIADPLTGQFPPLTAGAGARPAN